MCSILHDNRTTSCHHWRWHTSTFQARRGQPTCHMTESPHILEPGSPGSAWWLEENAVPILWMDSKAERIEMCWINKQVIRYSIYLNGAKIWKETWNKNMINQIICQSWLLHDQIWSDINVQITDGCVCVHVCVCVCACVCMCACMWVNEWVLIHYDKCNKNKIQRENQI